MTHAFVFSAALICSDCVLRVPIVVAHLPAERPYMLRDVIAATKAARIAAGLPDGCTDTDTIPDFAGYDGGGAADSAQHCDQCGTFLRNPLTGEGEQSVADAFAEWVETGHGAEDVLCQWRNFYGSCVVSETGDGQPSDLVRRCVEASLDNADAFARMLAHFGACQEGCEYAHGLTLRAAWVRACEGVSADHYGAAHLRGFVEWFADVCQIPEPPIVDWTWPGNVTLAHWRHVYPVFPTLLRSGWVGGQ